MEELTLSPGAVGAGVDAPRRARDEARCFLDAQGLAALADDVLLVVSELVTNAVVHANAAPELVLRRHAEPPCLPVEVRDPSPVMPVAREPDLAGWGGRGIRLVSATADRWGVEVRGAAGKMVWAQFR